MGELTKNAEDKRRDRGRPQTARPMIRFQILFADNRDSII
jgi:hypothetical protein